MFKRLFFWLYTKKTDFLHPAEVHEILQKITTPLASRSYDILTTYITSGSVTYTASKFNITRERLRQILNKYKRMV